MGKITKRFTVLMLVVVICMTALPQVAFAADDERSAAERLHMLGLFQGVGNAADGTPNFDLDRAPTRAEAVVMFVRLLGASDDAYEGIWVTPFTDVPAWAEPYVGYAYANELTFGVSATEFGSGTTATASMYLTFILRALGYTSGVDFEWNTAWVLSDDVGVTDGQFNAGTTTFLRGDVALISYRALDVAFAGSNTTLAEMLIDNGVFTGAQLQSARTAVSTTPTTPTTPGVQPTSVAVSPATANVVIGATRALSASVRPTNAADRTVTWSSSNTSVATVSSAGVVTAVAAGTATITATLPNGITGASTITVPAAIVPTGVTISPATLNIGINSTRNFNAGVQPHNVPTAGRTVTWSSSNPSVATISDAGLLRAVSGGTTTITATTTNGLTATATVRVPSSIVIPNRQMTDSERQAWMSDYRAMGGATDVEREVVRLVNIERARHNLEQVQIDERLMMAARFYSQMFHDLPGGSSARGHNFGPYGGSAGVARAFEGHLGGWGGGNWFSGGGMTAEALVSGWMNSPGHRNYILRPEARFMGAGQFPGGVSYMFLGVRPSGAIQPESVTISPNTATVNIGATRNLSANVQPNNATDRTVTWSSADTAIATVSSTGVVTATASGTTTITATTVNGRTATATITVPGAIQPTGVTVSATSATLSAGGTRTFTANVQPNNAANRTVTWSSSDTAVATVSSTGVVTAVAGGTATITATTVNGLTATIIITVPGAILPTSVTITQGNITMDVGHSRFLMADVLPSNAANRAVTWSSSNTSVATVSSTGEVTAVTQGTAVITATTVNGLTATSSVTVAGQIQPTSVTVSPTSDTINIGETRTLTANVQPANAADRSVTWFSSDSGVATVSDGVVTAVGAGTATITAATVNGHSATVIITVFE